ncbi:MAG: twin-arginine translocase subunit TatC [Proteobacteria bacterium]|nr:twin-arginine translocase subunit TatC [Pseudomonadota bacterium]
MSESETAKDSKSGSLMSHLFELRDRVVRMVLAVLVIFLGLFYWANDIYSYLAAPLTRHLPEGSTMIAIDVASPFLTPFKLVLMLSVFLAMPVILYQFWAFVAPGLYKNEKRIAGPLLVSSIFLFYAGMAFAYYIVFPLVFGFFTSIGPEMVNISTDIGRYLDFVLALFFGFGIAFEVPIATIILVAIGFTTPAKLAEKRPYIIVGAFIFGMFLTPPDVISQVLLAIPIWILFEAGVIASRIIFKDRLLEAEAENDLDDSDDDDDDDDDDSDSDDVAPEVPDHDPPNEEEMDAELDSIEESDAADTKLDKPD